MDRCEIGHRLNFFLFVFSHPNVDICTHTFGEKEKKMIFFGATAKKKTTKKSRICIVSTVFKKSTCGLNEER